VTLLAALLAGALAEVILPFGNNLLGYKLTLAPLHDPQAAGFLVLLVVIVGFLSGLYPALVLSGFNPVAALKGQSGSSLRKGLILRRGLVIAQFAISQALIFGTIVLTAQLDFWRQKDLGFASEATVVADLPRNEAATLGTLRSRLLQDSRVHEVSFSSVSPLSDVWNGAVYHRLHGSEEEYITDFKYADAHYASLFGLKFVAGRNYQEADSARELVVNEAFARGLGIAPQDLIGKTIEMVKMRSNAQIREPLPVVGVVKDFNERPLQDGIYPTLLTSYRPFYYQASIKIDIHNMQEALAHIERCWSAAYPAFLFQAQFLDERITGYYKEEETTAGMVRILTGLAIAIGMMGLFGLVSFMAARRTKEIGVRKVLGAGVADILLLFLREFALLILIAFAVAAPAAYFVMSRWLEDFAYRITPGPGVFALSLAVTCVVAALSVGYQVVRASLANPVSALRYE
ncbi:MAG TPA: FtsX-like permease family protein, partial [Bacteroidota bacterium]